ncbi:DUF4139 domain-containing protein [Thiocapsa imhoffii]|nr:DUF4139 domain-containing protein [Thiocapsa imhoffii]
MDRAQTNQEQRVDDSTQEGLAVTIYNADLALVKDRRRLTLQPGLNRLAWRNVSVEIQPETALLSEASGQLPFELIEQNFDFDLLTPDSLLKKYVGRTVQVIRTNDDGDQEIEDAILLAANDGIVLRYADRIETALVGHLAFPDVPTDLRDQPTLILHLAAETAGEGLFELSYLTNGLAWQADYVADLSPDGQTMDLNGWITLTNHSGIAYRSAQIQVVAGEVNRVINERPEAMMARDMVMASPQAMPEQESLDEYHLYTLPRPTDIQNNQTKQVALLSAPQVTISRELRVRGEPYRYQSRSHDGWSQRPVTTTLRFENEGDSLGIPLPKGIVRVYAKDSAGNAQFIGEDSIDHTPRNETVVLSLGESFDVTARRRQTEFRKLAGTSAYDYAYEAAFELELKNAKSDAVEVTVLEQLPGDWSLLQESQPHTKEAANLVSWRVTVPAEGTTTLSWRALVRF